MARYQPFSSDGEELRWLDGDDGHEERTSIAWENEGWTVSGLVSRERVQYVLRLTAGWQISQFLLFRDLDEPDLWLGTDGAGRWGEINGAHRPELDGCYDLTLSCTPFPHALPVRRLQLEHGASAHLGVVHVDPETLAVRRIEVRYTCLGPNRWRFEDLDQGETVDLAVDEHGIVLDLPPRWRRAPTDPHS